MLPRVEFASIRFGDPVYFWLFAIPVLLLAVWGWRFARNRRDVQRLQTGRPSTTRGRLARLGEMPFWFCLIVAVALVILALARPQSPAAVVRQAGIDLLILQDGSTSMRVKDLTPDRWQRSMRFLRTIGESMSWKDDRVALIVYATIAAPQVRLTKDPNTFFFFLDNLTKESPFRLQEAGSWNTDIELAIGGAVRMVKRDEEIRGPSRNAKVMILISDGEIWSGDVGATILEARKERIPIYVVGSGTLAGGQMPTPMVVTDIFRNPEGEEQFDPNVPERSVLNRSELQRIAGLGGGQYFELDRDGDRQIANSIIDVTRKRAPTIDISETAEELYWYPLVAAALMLGVGLLFIRDRLDLWIQAAAAGLILLGVTNLLR